MQKAILCITGTSSLISFTLANPQCKLYYGSIEDTEESILRLIQFATTYQITELLMNEGEKKKHTQLTQIANSINSEQITYLPNKAFKIQQIIELLPRNLVLYINKSVDLESTPICSAISGCCYHLLQNKININGIELEEVPISELLAMDDKSYKDLNIFNECIHPSLIKGKGRSKEGLSVFSMLDYTVTPMGHSALRDYMKFPVTNEVIINERLNRIGEMIEFISQNNSAIKNLRKVKELKQVMHRIEAAEYDHHDFLQLHKSLSNGIEYCAKLYGFMKQSYPNSLFISEIESLQLDTLKEVYNRINNIVDVKMTKKENSLKILKGVNKLYDKFLTQSEKIMNSQSLLSNYSSSIMAQCKILFNPVFHFCIYYYKDQAITEIPSEWEMLWEDSKVIIFDSNDLNYINETIVPLYYQSKADIDIMFNELISGCILANTSMILFMVDYIGVLDAFSSIACASIALNLVRPKIVSSAQEIRVIGAKHIIGEQLFKSFIKNDITIHKQKVELINGPNSSGKTVLIKEIAIIIYLAHLGVYVPCDSAEIPIFTKILCLFPEKESSSLGISYFTKQLSKLVRVIKSIDKNTIIFMDEFQTGTDQADGMALYCSILESFLDPKVFEEMKKEEGMKNAERPTLLGSCHLQCPPVEGVRYWHMGIMYHKDKFECTYKLVEGDSSGCDIISYSKMIGMRKDVIKRAEQVINERDIRPLSLYVNNVLKLSMELVKCRLWNNIDSANKDYKEIHNKQDEAAIDK